MIDVTQILGCNSNSRRKGMRDMQETLGEWYEICEKNAEGMV
jgi:hypothetical protein